MPGIMTFLKKLGQVLVNAAGIAAGIGPIITPFLGSGKAGQVAGVVVNDLTLLAQRATEIEVALQGKSGPEKLAALIPLVNNVIKTSEVVSGKKIANDTLFAKGCEEYAQATVDILNSLHPDEVHTT